MADKSQKKTKPLAWYLAMFEPRDPDFEARVRASFAAQSAKIDEADFHILYEHGFSDEDIWDIGAITALFALSNRMASLISMRPNDEFFTMGRSFGDAK